MRRSSIVGPLLLIGIGVLFLARNVFPELPLLDYLARYWPFLLILWGSLRLVEILVWAGRGKPLPSYGMSGGEWLLVILLCMIGGTVHAARGVSTWLPRMTLGGLEVFGESFPYPVSGEHASSKTPKVVIPFFRGSARITGADVDKVTVTGHTTIRSLDRAAADRTNEKVSLELSGDQNQVEIRSNQNRASDDQRVTSELQITVPKGASIEGHGRRGDFDISGVNGSIDIESDNAGVRLDTIGGSVRLNLRNSDSIRVSNVKGGVELKGRGNDIDFENIEGPVAVEGSWGGVGQFRRMAKPVRFTNQFTEFSAEAIPGSFHTSIGDVSANGVTGPVRVTSTRSKDVDLGAFTGSLEIELNRGDVILRPGALPIPRMNVHTRNGDIELSLPEGAKFDMTATSDRGEVVNDFGAPLTRESIRRGASLRGSNGGPMVTLLTGQGEITVRKASPGDAERAPKSPKAPAPLAPPTPPAAPEPPRPLNQ